MNNLLMTESFDKNSSRRLKKILLLLGKKRRHHNNKSKNNNRLHKSRKVSKGKVSKIRYYRGKRKWIYCKQGACK